jgi:hypothetical protein
LSVGVRPAVAGFRLLEGFEFTPKPWKHFGNVSSLTE